MIRSNQTLLKLSLDLDLKNESGGTAIAEAMRINTTITDLSLGNQGDPWPMDAAMRAEVDNTLRINKFLRGVDSDGKASGAAPTATQFPLAASAVAAASQPAQTPVIGPPAASTLAPALADSAVADAPTSQALHSQPLPQPSSAGVVASNGTVADSPGSMLELLRKKLDAFQGTESGAVLDSVAPVSAPPTAAPPAGSTAAFAPASAPAPAPAPQPTLTAAARSAESTVLPPVHETNESVLTPSPTTTGMMVSADELQQLHERVRASHTRQ